MKRAGIKGYDVLLRDNKKNLVDDKYETKYWWVNHVLKTINKKSNKLILYQRRHSLIYYNRIRKS